MIYTLPRRIAVALLVTLQATMSHAQQSVVTAIFDADHAAAVAKNPPGVTCTLHPLEGKTRFQQGETIRLALAFTIDRPGYKLARYDDGRRVMAGP